MFAEDDLVPISALQHLVFCPRQWALIHLEQIWTENRLTVEGKNLHENVDEIGTETRRDVRVCRALPIRSLSLGLIGRADVVEFHLEPETETWTPFPVEYKRGKPKPDRCDEVQLCAQAMCLEEMLDTTVPSGALYYASRRRREEVEFDTILRGLTRHYLEKLRHLSQTGKTPSAVYLPKCDNCSLINVCMPRVTAGDGGVASYVSRQMKQSSHS